jgi:hypothetical protein
MNTRLMMMAAALLVGVAAVSVATVSVAGEKNGNAQATHDAQAPHTEAAEQYTPAQVAIYKSNQIGSLSKNDVINYTFSRKGKIQAPLEDKASITIADEDAQGKKNIVVDFLTGDNHIDMPPYEGFKLGNPIWMVFLEHDVKEMSALTKGSTLYFRNRIRDGMASADKAVVTHTSITLGDQKFDATVVTLKPYVGVEHVESFKQFEQKSYQFVISAQVPGGIYSIKTVTPNADGKEPIMVESLDYASRSKS